MENNPLTTIEELEVYMASKGFPRDSYRIGVTDSQEEPYEAWEVHLTIPMGVPNLPEILKEFEDKETDIERFMHKGNSPKESIFGTEFYLALLNFQSIILSEAPEYAKYRNFDYSQLNTMAELNAHEEEQRKVAEKILARHEEFTALEKQLKNLI